MNYVVMIGILIAISIFLQKFVEPKDKIQIIKIIGGVTLSFVVFLVAYVVWDSYSDGHKKSWLTVEHLSFNENVQEEQGQALDAQKSGNTEISFNVCNNRDKPLEFVKFQVSGRKEGRSSEYKIINDNQRYGDYSELDSDLIIEPNKCRSISWTGSYILFSKYVIKYTMGRWADGRVFSTYQPLSREDKVDGAFSDN